MRGLERGLRSDVPDASRSADFDRGCLVGRNGIGPLYTIGGLPDPGTEPRVRGGRISAGLPDPRDRARKPCPCGSPSRWPRGGGLGRCARDVPDLVRGFLWTVVRRSWAAAPQPYAAMRIEVDDLSRPAIHALLN